MLPSKNITLGLIISTFFLCSFSLVESNPFGKIQKVVIDAGHGGKDPGTGGGKEKKYALDIALQLGNKIKNELSDVEIIYTRDKDIFIPLHERANIANRSKADLFISIHCNAFKNSNVSGTETYTMGLHKTEANLELAKRENNVILLEDNYAKSYKGFNPNSPLAHIMLANYQSAFMEQSIRFASKVETKMKEHGHTSRGVKQAGFLVIWETTMPSVLIETGYLSNPKDREKLDSEKGRENISNAIFKAFKSYKLEVEANQ
jgi:N-acetylmuramoyl-L-alanine amidase